MSRAKRPRRTRRTAGDARRAILDAAERQLAAGGPASLRLQEVAAEVGVSHPALLHHFGSRERLIEAVVERAQRALEEDLVRAFAGAAAGGPPDPGDLLERVRETMLRRGQARLLAWLALSGREPPEGEKGRANWAAIAKAAHEGRARILAAEGRLRDLPHLDDTRFTLVLCALVVFADSIAGAPTLRLAGLGRGAEKRFRAWFADLVRDHLANARV